MKASADRAKTFMKFSLLAIIIMLLLLIVKFTRGLPYAENKCLHGVKEFTRLLGVHLGRTHKTMLYDSKRRNGKLMKLQGKNFGRISHLSRDFEN